MAQVTAPFLDSTRALARPNTIAGAPSSLGLVKNSTQLQTRPRFVAIAGCREHNNVIGGVGLWVLGLLDRPDLG